MSQYAVTTYADRVIQALAFKNTPLWFGLGHTTTVWPDENNPPSPAPGATDIQEAMVFFQASLMTLVRPVSAADYALLDSDKRVIVNGQHYKFVTDANAQAEQARWVYVKGFADPSLGHPTGTYRQEGLFSGLIPQAGYEQASWLLPAYVQSRGTLRWLDNNPPVALTSTFRVVCNVIREFR